MPGKWVTRVHDQKGGWCALERHGRWKILQATRHPAHLRRLRRCRTPQPNHTLQGSDLRLEFPFSKGYLSAVGTDATGDSIPGATGKTLVKTPVKILEHLSDHPDATLEEVATAIGKSKSAVEPAAAKLRDENRLRCVGPAKGGHREVIEKGDHR